MTPRRFNLAILLVGLAAVVACGVGWCVRPVDFVRGYLPAFLFWASVPLGSLAFMLIHQLTGGDWGKAIVQPATACILTLPLVAVFFVPVILGMEHLYPWAGTSAAREMLHLGHKAAYLNTTFFLVRAAICFVVWMVIGFSLVSMLRKQSEAFDAARAGRLRALGAGGMVLFVLIGTVMAIDWMMSLEPNWYSSIYGFYVIAGEALTGMAFLIAVLVVRDGLAGAGPPRLRPAVLHDLGTLLFATVFFYAYIAFSQYLIIWSGNTAEEVPWYVERGTGYWGIAPKILALTQLAIPFLLLLSRTVKRRGRAMLKIVLLLLAAHVLDTCWMVMPAYPSVTPTTWLMALAAFVGIGCVWWTLFVALGGADPVDPVPEDAGAVHELGKA